MSTHASNQSRISKLLKVLVWVFSTVILFAAAIYIAFQVSPWPSVMLIRYGFSTEGSRVNEELGKHVPNGIISKLDISYDHLAPGAAFDIYHQADLNTKLPLIVWVHGGGFVAGDKRELSNYCKILASKNFIVAAVNYTVAPKGQYPVPVGQVNTALAFLIKNAEKFKIDTAKIIVAGDSGGAHITAQVANVYTNSEYASMLGITPSISREAVKGVILYCGPYNTDLVDFKGAYGGFLNTVLWAYMGTRNFFDDPKFVHFSVAKFITEKFPPTFISVGNEDPLSIHSHDLASRLSSKSVRVDSLFFPDDYRPGLPHEYQFNLDNEAGKQALERTLSFLSKCVNEPE